MEELLKKIVDRFIKENKNEIENDRIDISTAAEWWIKTCDEYGYRGMESIAIGYKIERMIYNKIYNEFKPTYIIYGGLKYVNQCIERKEPIVFSFKYTDYMKKNECDYFAGENIIWATSKNAFINMLKDMTGKEVLFDIHMLVEKGIIKLPERCIELIKEEINI